MVIFCQEAIQVKPTKIPLFVSTSGWAQDLILITLVSNEYEGIKTE